MSPFRPLFSRKSSWTSSASAVARSSGAKVEPIHWMFVWEISGTSRISAGGGCASSSSSKLLLVLFLGLLLLFRTQSPRAPSSSFPPVVTREMSEGAHDASPSREDFFSSSCATGIVRASDKCLGYKSQPRVTIPESEIVCQGTPISSRTPAVCMNSMQNGIRA